MPVDGLLEGYNASRNYWGSRRSEAARAFSEFRQLNPNSSYSDYKGFVDQITGGNSYLRGAIPSDQILQKIAEEGQRRQQHEQMQQRLEMLRSQAQLSGTIGALAQQYATQFDNDAEVEDALVASLGGNDLARQQVRKMYGKGFGPIRQRAQYAALKDNLPLAIQILEANPDADLGSIFPEMPQTFLKSIATSAQEKLAEKQRAKEEEEYTRAIQAGETAIRMGGSYTLPSGISQAAAERARPVLDAYKTRLDTEKKAADDLKRTESLKRMVDELKADPGFLASMSQPGFNPLSVMIERAKQYGIDEIKADELAPYVQDLTEDSVNSKKAILKEMGAKRTELAKTQLSAAQTAAVEGLTTMLGEGGALAERAGPYAGAAGAAVKSLGLEYDLSNSATQSAIAQATSAQYLESKGVDPADVGAVTEAIISHPAFTSSTRTLAQAATLKEVAIEGAANAVPDDVMSFKSWVSTYEMDTAEQVQKVQQAILPILQSGPNADGSDDMNKLAVVEQSIKQVKALQLKIRDNLVQAAKTSDMWIMPGTGAFDINVAGPLAEKRIAELAAIIQQLEGFKKQTERGVVDQAAAQESASRAARAQEQRIRQGTWMEQTKRDLFSTQTRPITPTNETEAIWPGDENLPAPPPSPWDSYWNR